MADITMCSGEGCEPKETCYRYKAVPNKYTQSYFKKPPIENNGCEHYLNTNLQT
jgi:hypothetical protein